MFVPDEDSEADCEAYDCDACPLASALYELDGDPVNRKAWALYRQSVTRLTFEGHALGAVLDRLTADCEIEEYAELLARLAFAFDVFNPPPEPSK